MTSCSSIDSKSSFEGNSDLKTDGDAFAADPPTAEKQSKLDICVGDKVIINTAATKSSPGLVDERAVVMYIGYPFKGHTVRYGVKLEHSANGDNDGSQWIHKKTGKITHKKHLINSYKKRHQKRRFFRAKDNHGMFVKRDEISSLEVRASECRFTINNKVIVENRGKGTIKFVGCLEGHRLERTGTWYGVDLVRAIGKHDGTVKGVQYFKCAKGHGIHCRDGMLSAVTERRVHFEVDDADDAKAAASDPWIGILGPIRSMKHSATLPGQRTLEYGELDTPGTPMPSSPMKSAMGHCLSPYVRPKVNRQCSSLQLWAGNANKEMLSEWVPRRAASDGMPPMMLAEIERTMSVMSMRNLLAPGPISFAFTVQAPCTGKTAKGDSVMNVLSRQGHELSRNFYDFYEFDADEDELGRGQFGEVYRCRTKEEETESDTDTDSETDDDEEGDDSDGSENEDSQNDEREVYAVKMINKAKFHHKGNQLETARLLRGEIANLRRIQKLKKANNVQGAEYLIELVDIFEDRNYLRIVTNLCSGGSLWNHIERLNDNRSGRVYSEVDIKRIMGQILSALSVLHSQKVAHLDLKPENIMFDSAGKVQVIDFGMSRVIPDLVKKRLLVGTPNYLAPEVIEGRYGIAADIFSAGIIFFHLRFGYPPFFINDNFDAALTEMEGKRLQQLILKGFQNEVKEDFGPWFPAEEPISECMMDLISKMLRGNPAERPTVTECLVHEYFESVADSNQLPDTVMNALTKFNGQCQFKVLISKLFAHQIDPKHMKQLRAVWDRFDENGDGSLTMAQFQSAMANYDHRYRDDQIEAMFDSLDYKGSAQISFDELVTAFSYQRLVAVDERLWAAFSELDADGDGKITKSELLCVLRSVDPTLFEQKTVNTLRQWIDDSVGAADDDFDGMIDYEEFLMALHPEFNEPPVTPGVSSRGLLQFNDPTICEHGH